MNSQKESQALIEQDRKAAIIWLENITNPSLTNLPVLSSENQQIMSPARAAGAGDYVKKAKAAQTQGKAPVSVFEGMQSIANLCRSKAGYDPLDVRKDGKGKGNKEYFLRFTGNLAKVPFLTVLNADSKQIEQKSKDSSTLINGFVNAFTGLAKEDQAQVQDSVTQLANAALSYAGQEESESNFAQNLLQVNSSGDVQFSLHYSQFSISAQKSKGSIKFQSSYELAEAVYELSKDQWERIKPSFEQQEKTAVEDWLKNMSTQPNKDLEAPKTPCLATPVSTQKKVVVPEKPSAQALAGCHSTNSLIQSHLHLSKAHTDLVGLVRQNCPTLLSQTTQHNQIVNVIWDDSALKSNDGDNSNIVIAGNLTVRTALIAGFTYCLLTGMYVSITGSAAGTTNFDFTYNGTLSAQAVKDLLIIGANITFS